jgi:hypothetical protein
VFTNAERERHICRSALAQQRQSGHHGRVSSDYVPGTFVDGPLEGQECLAALNQVGLDGHDWHVEFDAG